MKGIQKLKEKCNLEVQKFREKMDGLFDKFIEKQDKKKGKSVPVVESLVVEGVPDAGVKPVVEGV